MQTDRMQMRQNSKRQNTNVTKYKKTIHKYDKTQNTNTNTNVTKYKKKYYKY